MDMYGYVSYAIIKQQSCTIRIHQSTSGHHRM